MKLAREGSRELVLGTLVLACAAILALAWCRPLVPVCVVLWAWLLWFFRDPRRVRVFGAGELCAPADGKVTEVKELQNYGPIDGPAVRVGIFLSIFDVHVNRAPCTGRVVSVQHRPGRFLDARDAGSGTLNEATAVVLEPRTPLPGPVVVRQVAGRVARRIVCHGVAGDRWQRGQRIGMIKFGSRTELIVPRLPKTEVCVGVGARVRGGVTVLVRQPVPDPAEEHDGHHRQARGDKSAATT
jgi:phosphatidylserine decarboxylase